MRLKEAVGLALDDLFEIEAYCFGILVQLSVLPLVRASPVLMVAVDPV